MVHAFFLPLVFVVGVVVGLWLERKAARRAAALELFYDRRPAPIPQPIEWGKVSVGLQKGFDARRARGEEV